MRIQSLSMSACAALFIAVGSLHAASITGPVVGGKQGKAFNLPEVDLAKHGYVAEEFFLDGTATAYELAPGTTQGSDGRWKLRKRPDAAPFRTRILIVRPVDAKQFNGSVIVHWQNVTAGYEL